MAKSKSKPKASTPKTRPVKGRPVKARTTRPHALPKAVPPADDPLRRFVEQNTDLLTGNGVPPSEAGAALMATAAPAAAERGPTARGGTPARTDDRLKKSAEFRLSALEHSRAMVFHEPGGPTPAAVALPATGGFAPVAPIAGTSNWVPLGPTAIPNGQTYSSARVLV